MIKLYGSGASRWVNPFWVLKERNPYGKVPVLEDSGFVPYESLAICN